MGVRAHASAPPPRVRSVGPGPGRTLVVVLLALVPLLANGRPVGSPDASGVGGWLLGAATALAGRLVQLDTAGEALVGKLLAALFAALAAGFLFSAVARRHGPGEARWAGLLLALGTTLAAAAQAWSGEAAATCAVAAALVLLVRSEEEAEAGPAAMAGVPLGLAVAFQPSSGAIVVVLLAAVLVRWGRAGLLVLAGAAPGLLLGFAFGSASLSGAPGLAPGAGPLALLASPAKGALVFAPVALVGIAGLLGALRAPARRLWDQAPPGRLLPVACGAAAVAHLTALSLAGGWSTGEFWGPRWVAPAWPLLLLFVPEGFARLRILASLLAVASVGVQALGVLAYDGRWDRLFREPSAGGREERGGRADELGTLTWDVGRSPIVFQARERSVRLALPSIEGRRLVLRSRVIGPAGASGSFVSFAKSPPAPTGVERTMSGLRLEGGARVEGGRLQLRAAGDGVAFRVPEVARARRLELRVVGRGAGTLGLGESDFGKDARWRERDVSGSFRLRLEYHHPESGGADLLLALREGGPIGLDSVALVPPTEPENVLRLP